MKKKIRILGAGSDRCARLFALTDQAALELGIDYSIESIDMPLAVMGAVTASAPALEIDGKIEFAGGVPAVEEIKRILTH